jgi:hypothetical protein
LPNLNLNNLISDTLATLHSDTLANLVFTSDPEITRVANDELRRLAQRFGLFVARDESIFVISAQATYRAPSNFLDGIYMALEGVPLRPTSRSELELRDTNYQTTLATATNPVQYWYTDRQGQNIIGLYPVPGVLDDDKLLEVIYHEYPCNLDEAHVSTLIETPAVLGDLLKLVMIRESYAKESDFQQVDVAATLKRVIQEVYDKATAQYWGTSQ